VRVDVLGPVMMTGTAAVLGGTLRQVLLYLTMHRRPVQPRALWEAVWPDRDFNDHSLRSRCNELKRYLHRQLLKDGRAWVLPETVRCDWQEFKALAAGDTDSKLTALALVRGRPFEDFAPDWIHLEGFASEVEATIVDLALEVATDALERGDTMTASFAAAAGVKASPYEERLVQLGIRAAEDRGAHSLARSLHRQLTVVLDEEIEPDDNELPSTSRLMADLNYAESLERYRARRATDT
jgi:DNA-binding SARP family transcriptional activator